MGTNFYYHTARKDLKGLFGSKAEIVDWPEFGYQIHVAKTSAGWMPSFEAHEAIRSVADLKALYDKGGVRIFDEYGTEYDWPGFVDRVVEFGDENNWRCEAAFTDLYDSRREFTSVDGYRFSDYEFC